MSRSSKKVEDQTPSGVSSSTAIIFEREETTEDPNKTVYGFGLLPSVRRYCVHVMHLTLSLFTGEEDVDSDGNPIVSRRLGDVSALSPEEYEQALESIKRTVLIFNFNNKWEVSPSKKVIDQPISGENKYKFRPNEYPLGQFCFLAPVSELVEKYGDSWRDRASAKPEPLIPWSKKMEEKFGNPWAFPKPPKLDEENKDLKGNVLIDPS